MGTYLPITYLGDLGGGLISTVMTGVRSTLNTLNPKPQKSSYNRGHKHP